MTLKKKLSLLVFLTSVSIVSIGFSSWSITAETTAEINGNIQVDNVVSSDKYIYLDTSKGDNNTGISCFKYQEYGYLEDDGITLTDESFISTYYLLDLKMCDELLIGDYDSLKLTFTLKYTAETVTTLNLFKNEYGSDGYHEIIASFDTNEQITFTIQNTPSKNDVIEYKSEVVLNDMKSFIENNANLETIELELKHTLFASIGPYFYDNIYRYLYSDEISTGELSLIDFAIEVRISTI